MRGSSRGQTWSTDLVIAVVIFGFMAVIFYSLLVMQNRPSVDDLQTRAQVITEQLEKPVSKCGTVLLNQTVDAEELRCLFNEPYLQVKNQLQIEGDFCIYLEDSNGNLYIVGNTTTGYRTGFGNPNLIVGGTACGVPQ